MSDDGGQSWTTRYTYYWTTNLDGEAGVIDLTQAAAGRSDVRVRFLYVAIADYFWFIDTVRVVAW